MSKKIFKIFFFFIFLLSILVFYLALSKKNKVTNIEENVKEEIINKSNIINDVNYSSKDSKGNEYIVQASVGEIDYNNTNIIYLTDVKAFIILENKETIKIVSNFGKYNIENFNTIFSKNVGINYLENKITSDYLDFSMIRNSMIISKNVIYINVENKLKADVVEINLENKNTKIYMLENNKKVQIEGKSNMAIIKKFRIKSFKNINTIIEFENVSLAYGNRLILDNINFKINESQIFGMLGPNGVGKSTIFNLITGLIKPRNGKIKIAGEEVTNFPVYYRTKKFKVGYVPQYGGFFNDLTLNDNLKAISEIVIENKNYRSERINYLISKFELDNLKTLKLNFYLVVKKKLVIAIFIKRAKVLLLDECFAALDVLTIKMLQEIIVNLQQESKITICICDHQARDLLACVDVAMILNNGKIIAKDTPSNLVNNINAKNAYFGDSFKFN